VLGYPTPADHSQLKHAAVHPRPLGLLVEDVTRFKKSCFCASLSHHKGNAERLVQ